MESLTSFLGNYDDLEGGEGGESAEREGNVWRVPTGYNIPGQDLIWSDPASHQPHPPLGREGNIIETRKKTQTSLFWSNGNLFSELLEIW